MGSFFALFDRSQDMRILMIGLDAAGKTTVLYKLKVGEVVQTTPTIGFNVETLKYKSVNFTVWDIGGQDKLRALWRHYYANTDGLIFVVDSADRARINEVAYELNRVLREDELRGASILILANKQDLPGAMSVAEIASSLELPSLRHKWHVQSACASTGEGLYEGLDWLCEAVNK